MGTHPASFSFGDPLGATVAFVYFGVLAGVIGGVLFHVTRRLMRTRSTDQRGALHRGLISGTISMGVAGGILAGLYVSSLSGFYGVEVQEDRVRLHYILPARMEEISLTQIAEVSRIPTFKGQWRCVIATSSGRVYYSVHAGPAAVREAVHVLRRRVAAAGERQSRAIPSSQVP